MKNNAQRMLLSILLLCAGAHAAPAAEALATR